MTTLPFDIEQKFQQYPQAVADNLLRVRNLIVTTAEELNIVDLQETLKWGEPSYISKTGSAIRFDWKSSSPENFYIYFNCKTVLIETIRELYGDELIYQGNRALVFKADQPLPVNALQQCFTLALEYKERRRMPLLGAVRSPQ